MSESIVIPSAYELENILIADSQSVDYDCIVRCEAPIENKQGAMGIYMSSVQNIESTEGQETVEKVVTFQDIANLKMKEAAEVYFAQLLDQSAGYTGRQLLDALQSKELEPWLDHLTVPGRTAATVTSITGKRRGRPPGAAKKASPTVEREKRPVGRPKTVTAAKESRVYTVFSPEQRKIMKESIYALISAHPGDVSTPMIIAEIQKSNAAIKAHAVVGLIHDLEKAKNVKKIKGKPIKYKVGIRPL